MAALKVMAIAKLEGKHYRESWRITNHTCSRDLRELTGDWESLQAHVHSPTGNPQRPHGRHMDPVTMRHAGMLLIPTWVTADFPPILPQRSGGGVGFGT